MRNFLWAKGVHRRDISFGDLVYRKNANGEFLCGVLNDWGLGKLDGKGKQSLFHTGTRADRKSTRLNSSHSGESRMPSSA